MQFVKCTFPTGGRPYTYHWDGEAPLAPEDKVWVDSRQGEAVVTVVDTTDEQPPFETKPILRKWEPPVEEPQAEAAE